jgi:hypothetical protein
VPTLLEVQNAFRDSIIAGDDTQAATMLAEHIPPDRLAIYRNTSAHGLARALRLSYPAVHRLVGDDFFAAAAEVFTERHPPRSACLDQYGGEFPGFLERFPPAAALSYLPQVARLEWAVSRALHASDTKPLALSDLAALSGDDQGRVCFVPHPCVDLICVTFAADLIWRAVLAHDDDALAAIAPEAASICWSNDCRPASR